MDFTSALERLRDGMNTQLRELDLDRNPGFPHYSDLTGAYSMVDSYLPNRWAGSQWIGFLAGRLWLLGELFESQRDRYHGAAAELCRRIEPALSRGPVSDENAGFDVLHGLAWGYNVTGDSWYKDAAMSALHHLSVLFDERFGVFLCSASSDEVVVDTAGPLSGFLWAYGVDAELDRKISTHMDSILEFGLIDDSGAATQGVQFNLADASVRRLWARQGYREDTKWTRAQAWAINNYLNAYEAIGVSAYLAAAERAARWFLDRLPVGGVNFYDYDDPRRPEIPWDTCSTLMAANSFLRLDRIVEQADPDAERWRDHAEGLITSVAADHMTLSGTVLHGSWGNARYSRKIGRFPQEDVMCYGNYWIVESLYRCTAPDWTATALGSSKASVGVDA